MSKPFGTKKDLSPNNSLHKTNPKVKSPRSAVDIGSNPVKVNIKGCTKEFFPPTKILKLNTEAPKNKLVLDWVFGYNGSQVTHISTKFNSNKSFHFGLKLKSTFNLLAS